MPFMWTYEKINQVHIELSTHCNARCPMCPRHTPVNTNGDGSTIPFARPDLVLESVTYENFVKWFPLEFTKKIKSWVFCGTHGDPMMCKDVLEITRYVCEAGCDVLFNTNGGMRDANFWKEIAEVLKINPPKGGGHRRVIFSIDGLHDTSHLYRVNVPYEKAMRNAKTYIDAGGKASWDYLIFKHNEHQIEEAQKISREMGFEYFVPKKALGFMRESNGNLRNKIVRGADGSVSHIIEPPTSEDNANYLPGHTRQTVTPEHEPRVDVVELIKIRKAQIQTIEAKTENYNTMISRGYVPSEEESCINVSCKSLNKLYGNVEIYVDAAGLVHPCCYVGTRYNANFALVGDYQLQIEIEKNGLDNISLKQKSLKEIIDNGYLHNTFETKWGKRGMEGMLFCNETCGEKSSIDRIFTHELDERPAAYKTYVR